MEQHLKVMITLCRVWEQMKRKLIMTPRTTATDANSADFASYWTRLVELSDPLPPVTKCDLQGGTVQSDPPTAGQGPDLGVTAPGHDRTSKRSVRCLRGLSDASR